MPLRHSEIPLGLRRPSHAANRWYDFTMKLSEQRLDRTAISMFASFEAADRAEREYWHSRTPDERLAAMELMRQAAYGYNDSATSRLQRVLEIVVGE